MEARAGYLKNRGVWLAVIVENVEVVCVGCEVIEDAARVWAREALLFHKSIEGVEHPKDMYDRADGGSRLH